MFQGSENLQRRVLQAARSRSARPRMNGTTSFDRTNYFQNVPTTRARPRALDGIRPHGTSARRDRPGAARRAARRGPEREAAGREPAVRARLRRGVARASFPVGPPVSLAADRLDGGPRRRDARRRARSGSGPITARRTRCWCWRATSTSPTARAQAQKYFGDIPPGPALTRPETGSRRAPRATRETMYDQVAQTRCTRSGTRRRTAPTTPTARRSSARSSAAARRRGCTSGSSTATRSPTARPPASSRSRSRGCSASRPTSRPASRAQVEAAIARNCNASSLKGPTPPSSSAPGRRCAPASSAASSASAVSAARPTCSRPARCTRATRPVTRRSLRAVAAATPAQVRQRRRALARAGRLHARGAAAADVPGRRQLAPSIAARARRSRRRFRTSTFPALQRAKLANGMPVIVASAPGRARRRVSAAVRRRLRGRPRPQAGHLEFRDGHARRGRRQARRARDRRPRGALGAELGGRLRARHVVRRGLGADRAARAVARAARRRGARPDVPAATRSSACARNGSPAIPREKTSPEALALRVLPPLLYGDGPSVRDPVLGLRHRGLDRRADPRRPARIPARLAAAGQRHDDRDRRHDASSAILPLAREAVRRLARADGSAAGESRSPEAARPRRARACSCIDKPGCDADAASSSAS